jgi:hypothetical protein
MDLFEVQGGMSGVAQELAKCDASLLPNAWRETRQRRPKLPRDVRVHNRSGSNGSVLPARRSASASSARLANL